MGVGPFLLPNKYLAQVASKRKSPQQRCYVTAKLDQINSMIAPAIEALGYELWGLEQSGQGSNQLLRIYIEHAEGIGVDDCAKVSHQVSGILDVEDPISGEYTLEVSSPGVDRPLFKLAHYEQYIGQKVSIRLRYAFEDRRNFRGMIAGIEQDEVVLRVDNEEYLFPIDDIDKAQLQGVLSNK